MTVDQISNDESMGCHLSYDRDKQCMLILRAGALSLRFLRSRLGLARLLPLFRFSGFLQLVDLVQHL
jgi:hypothetical protein